MLAPLLADGLGDGVEDGDALDVLPALAGRDAGDELRPVGAVAEAVEAPLGAGEPLDDEPRVVVDEDRHQPPLTARDRDLVERQPAVGDALARAARSTRSASSPSQPARSSQAGSRTCAAKKRTSSSASPASDDDLGPLVVGVVADVRRIAELLGLLDVVTHEDRVDEQHLVAR